MFRFLVSLLAIAVITVKAPARESTARQKLASEFIRAAVAPVANNPLTTTSLEAALLLAKEAVALDSDNAEIWHIALDLAQLAENDELTNRAIERLWALDPEDERVRLMRLNAALERYQTAEERAAACEKLLSDANVPRLGAAVSSALALDVALLYQRQGEINRFSQWLSKAIAWDSSNRAAAALAAGFFRMNLNDPLAEAELLVNLMLADPTDVTTQAALAQLLLDQGAFAGAERMYRLVTRSTLADRRTPANGLLADYAAAMWGGGNPDGALEVLRNRLGLLVTIYRSQFARERPELTQAELEQIPIPLDPNLTTVEAAIQLSGAVEDAAPWVDRVILSYDTAIEATKVELDRYRESPAAVAELSPILASLYLEQAWAGLWFGVDATLMEQSIQRAEALQPLTPAARARFDGWLAFRRGNLDTAVQFLQPIAESDISARVGLAMVLQQQGNLRDSASQLLAVVRAQPGSLLGIWAAAKLKHMLGQPVPPSNMATALNRLIASISLQFDRCADDSSLAIGLRIIPSKLTFSAHEPILLDVEITNHASIPLAIDRNGPIRPQLLIVPSVRSADAGSLGDLRPFIINIGRRLRLAPNQKLTIPMDLRNYRPADVLNMLAIGGGIVRLRATLNFSLDSNGNAAPGLYGVEVEAPLFRVDGHRITNEWMLQTTEALKQAPASGPVSLSDMVILAHVVSPRAAPSMVEDERLRGENARVALAEMFAKLDPDSQGWVLSTIPRGAGAAFEGIQPILAIARKSQDRIVQLVYLMFHSSGAADPMLDAALRGDDPVLRRLAELIKRSNEEAEAIESGQP